MLPGKQHKHRTKSDGIKDTPADFLPANSYVVYLDPAGVVSAIFFERAVQFIEETKALRERYRYIVLTFDGYGAHVSFRLLKCFKDNLIIAVGLPAHTSHRTQVLDYKVFSRFKTAFRNFLNERASFATSVQLNDVSTVCELLHLAYLQSVTYSNIISGFKACGVWFVRLKDVVPEVIN